MSDPLRIPCASERDDEWSQLEHDTEIDTLSIRVRERGIECHAFLDEAGARALFNWLGVWLHGGNRA